MSCLPDFKLSTHSTIACNALQPHARPRADLGLMRAGMKTLIANRGATACRIIRTLNHLGFLVRRDLFWRRTQRPDLCGNGG